MKKSVIAAFIALFITASFLSACGKKSPGAGESLSPDLTAAGSETAAAPADSAAGDAGADSASIAGEAGDSGVVTPPDSASPADTEPDETAGNAIGLFDPIENETETETEPEPVEDGDPAPRSDFKFKRTENGETWLDAYLGSASYVVIPDKDPDDGSPVTGIDVWAFRDNETVKKIVVPDTVTTIGKNAFMYCTALEEIKLPESLKTLGAQAFYRCSALKNVSIPEGFETLEYASFMFCENLEEITLPKSLKAVEDYVFAHCDALLTINSRGAESDWGGIAVSGSAMPPTWYTIVYGYAG